MIYDLSDLRGFKIYTLNGKIGTAHDFYFSPDDWKVYYLMCDAGYLMTDRIVIFYKEAIVRIEFENKSIFLNLDKNRILNSPYISSESVVTKLQRKDLHDYYGWSKYWEKDDHSRKPKKDKDQTPSKPERKNSEIETVDGLNCTREIINQIILADSTELGLLKNILMNSNKWDIVYVLIDQFKAISKKKLVIRPSWIHSFKGDELKIKLDKDLGDVTAGPHVYGADEITKETESMLDRVS